MTPKRCGWVALDNPLLIRYHDEEWGVPVHDDRKHFEFLVLEGAQAGLNWSIVLNKRKGYRRAFSEFDPAKVASYTEKRIQKLTLDSAIIRNRKKIESAVRNAKAFLAPAPRGLPQKIRSRGAAPSSREHSLPVVVQPAAVAA